jgi:hypothetical protein
MAYSFIINYLLKLIKDNFWFLLIFLAYLYMTFNCSLLTHKNSELKAKLQLQNEMIYQYKEDSNKLDAKIKESEREFENQKVSYDKRISYILSTKVSTNCQKAIEWGINQVNQMD